MTNKENAKLVIETLPEDASMDDIIHALYVKVKFSHGEDEIRNGRGLTQDQAKQRLAKWLK